MTVSSLDIYRTAKLVIQQHGLDAKDHAQARIAQLRAHGAHTGAETWERIAEAIKELQRAYTDHEIYEGARTIIAHHGGSALYVANGRLEDCRDLGDTVRVEMWTRVISAIEFLQAVQRPGEAALN